MTVVEDVSNSPRFHNEINVRTNKVAGTDQNVIRPTDSKIRTRLSLQAKDFTVGFPTDGKMVTNTDPQIKLTKDEFIVTVGESCLSMKADGTITIKGKNLKLEGDNVEAKAGDSEMTLSKKAAILKNKGELTVGKSGVKAVMNANKLEVTAASLKLVGKQVPITS